MEEATTRAARNAPGHRSVNRRGRALATLDDALDAMALSTADVRLAIKGKDRTKPICASASPP